MERIKFPSLAYDELVQKFMHDGKCASFSQARRMAAQTLEKDVHKQTVMTPQECEAEIAQIQDGAKSSFEREMLNQQIDNVACAVSPVIQTKKRRGRPPGSRNRQKGN